MHLHLLLIGLLGLSGFFPEGSPPEPPHGTPSASTALSESASEVEYQVFLLTMDQGDEVWEEFGHNAILIRDPDGQEIVWNWGLFDFQEVDFIPRFLQGTMRYSMGPAELDPFLDAYVWANRTIYANEIFLEPDEAEALDAFVRWNYRPENRDYTYHYFLDNCSTRLRDALDEVLGGWLADRFATRPTEESFRDHSRRLVQESLWVDQGLSFLLGARGDHPLTEWEAMFVPMELMRLLEEVERPEGGPLLGARDTIFLADRPSTPEVPPDFSFLWLLGGVAAGGGIAGLGLASGRGRRWATAGLGGAVILWGLVSGALGGILVGAWFTDHDFIQWNLNLFYLNPLGPVLAVVGGTALALGARGADGPAKAAVGLAALVALLSALAVVGQLTPFLTQGNAEVLAVALPVNVAMAWGLHRALHKPAHSAPERTTSP